MCSVTQNHMQKEVQIWISTSPHAFEAKRGPCLFVCLLLGMLDNHIFFPQCYCHFIIDVSGNALQSGFIQRSESLIHRLGFLTPWELSDAVNKTEIYFP